MKHSLFIILSLLVSVFLHAGENTFTYGASPWSSSISGHDLIVGFNIRKQGDAFTVVDFSFPANSKWRQLLDDRIKAGDFLESYFEIVMNNAIPKTRGMVVPGLDLVTGETLKDLAANAQWRRSNDIGKTLVLPGSQISTMRRITQNEFLHVVPKKVPDPTKKINRNNLEARAPTRNE